MALIGDCWSECKVAALLALSFRETIIQLTRTEHTSARFGCRMEATKLIPGYLIAGLRSECFRQI